MIQYLYDKEDNNGDTDDDNCAGIYEQVLRILTSILRNINSHIYKVRMMMMMTKTMFT